MNPASRNPFDERVASRYEVWYRTPEGRRADKLEKALLTELLQGFPQACRILEVGCGTGHFARWFGEQGLEVVGLDLSAAMLAQARALDEEREGSPHRYALSDAHQLPFSSRAFDLVAFITTLEFLTDPAVALEEATHVARQGLILGVLNRWSVLGLQRRLGRLFRPTIYDAARFYTVAELKELLQKATGGRGETTWYTTLFPRFLPLGRSRLPFGGFIGMSIMFISDYA